MGKESEEIARQVLRAFFGDSNGFQDMRATAERRAACKTVEEALAKLPIQNFPFKTVSQEKRSNRVTDP